MSKIKVLIVEKDVQFCKQIAKSLDDSFQVFFAHTCENAQDAFDTVNFDIVVASLNMPNTKLSKMISFVRDQYPDTRVIAISEQLNTQMQMAALIRIGALGVNSIVRQDSASEDLRGAVDRELNSLVSFA